MPKRSKSSERWLQRQRKDYFVRKAQDGGQVSRAHYKLAQIDERFHILSARKRVLELGAAPGRLDSVFGVQIDPRFFDCCRPVANHPGQPLPCY